MSGVGKWFENLRTLRNCVAQINLATEDNVYKFSKQTVGQLIGDSPARQGELDRCCQEHHLGACPPNRFNPPTKAFRVFMDEFGTPIISELDARCYRISREMTPPDTETPLAKFPPTRLDRIFKTEPPQQQLREKLFPEIAPEFLEGKGDLVAKAVTEEWTMGQFYEEIVK